MPPELALSGYWSAHPARIVVTSNGGPGANSLTVLDHDRSGHWSVQQTGGAVPHEGHGGLRFRLARPVDGAGVRRTTTRYGPRKAIPGVSVCSIGSAARRRSIDFNQGDFKDSYTGDLALDAERGMLYVVDQANFRVAVVDLEIPPGDRFRARGAPAVRAGALARPQNALRDQRRACSSIA